MKPDSKRKKELKAEYQQRHPDKGIVSWKFDAYTWVMISEDVSADFNSTSFQLKLGSWPNREMQNAYSKDPESFSWNIEVILDYDDPAGDYRDELLLMLMEYMEKYPEAKLMRPIRKK